MARNDSPFTGEDALSKKERQGEFLWEPGQLAGQWRQASPPVVIRMDEAVSGAADPGNSGPASSRPATAGVREA